MDTFSQKSYDQSMTILGLTFYLVSDTLVVERKRKEVATMTTIYKVKATFGSTPVEVSANAKDIAAMAVDPRYTIESIKVHTPVIRYATCEGCERCTTDEYVPHYNCFYGGKATGHSEAHCTAHACY